MDREKSEGATHRLVIDGEQTQKLQKHLTCIQLGDESTETGEDAVVGDGCIICGGELVSEPRMRNSAIRCDDCGARYDYREPIWTWARRKLSSLVGKNHG